LIYAPSVREIKAPTQFGAARGRGQNLIEKCDVEQANGAEPDPFEYLAFIVEQVRGSLAAGFYFPSLVTAVALPDVCGAVESDNGRAARAKYLRWIKGWTPAQGGIASAAEAVSNEVGAYSWATSDRERQACAEKITRAMNALGVVVGRFTRPRWWQRKPKTTTKRRRSSRHLARR
jgi:hypothetical protein